MKFTVVVPCYNRAHSVLPTLQSVQNQTFGDLECIVVDDGSDDSEALKTVISGLNDPRFRYIRRRNGGGGAARNTGIMQARGDYIAFLDSDDLFLNTKLETYLPELGDENEVLYAPMFVERGVDRQWIRPSRSIRSGEDVSEYLFVANQFIQTSTIVISRQLAQRVKFDPNLKKGQDLDFCVRLQAAGAKFRMLDTPLTVWVDISEDNRTSRKHGWALPRFWLNRSAHLMSWRARFGYRSTVLAYHMAREKPWTAFAFILAGLAAGVSIGVTLRQLARSFLPRGLYRTLVNQFVARFGRATA